MTFVGAMRALHIVTGVIALVSFWIPLVARKGGRLHRRAGWTYAVAMWAATVAAWLICVIRLTDEDRSNDTSALFLAFVGLLSANGAATGIRVLRTRSWARDHTSPVDLASSAVFLLTSLALGGWGLAVGSPLHVVFGVLGVFLSGSQLNYWRTGPLTTADWWTTHLANMIAACIGTVTAFLVVNVPRFGLERYGLVFWIAPGVIGGLGIAGWTRYYRRKLAPRAERPAAK